MAQLKTGDVEFLLNRARSKLPGSSDAGIKTELFAVITEILKDSNAWTEAVRLPVVANVQSYTIVPKDGGQIIRLGGVLDGNQVPVPASMQSPPTLDVMQTIQFDTLGVEAVTGRLDATQPWYVFIIKNIELPQTKDQLPVAPDWLLHRYTEIVLDGILGKMMTEQAKSYTNPQLGATHLKRYRDGIGEIRTDAWTQNLFGGQRWTFPQTFATYSQRGHGGPWPSRRF